MKTLLASLSLLLLTAAAHAQFSLTTFDGKTVSNKSKANADLKALESAFYYTWEADFVRIQWVTVIGTKQAVDETLLYYVDTDAVMPKLQEVPAPSGKGIAGYGMELKSKKGATLPNFNWRTDAYSQQMTASAMGMFLTKADAKAFFDRLAQKRKTAKPPVKRLVLQKTMKEKK